MTIRLCYILGDWWGVFWDFTPIARVVLIVLFPPWGVLITLKG
jgi:hypothetical protein